MKRKFYEFQKAHLNCDKEKKELAEKCKKIDKERVKINDKWIKLSQRLKEGDFTKDKQREI